MNNLYDLRCNLPASGYKPGSCHGLLFRISSTGGLETKCHRCHKIQLVDRTTLDKYQWEPLPKM